VRKSHALMNAHNGTDVDNAAAEALAPAAVAITHTATPYATSSDSGRSALQTSSFDTDQSTPHVPLHDRPDSSDSISDALQRDAVELAARVQARVFDCCDHCCGVDPLTVDGYQSNAGHDAATAQDFAKGRVFFGDGFWSDFWFQLRNAHSLLALFAQHPNNPYRYTNRGFL
jgi:hypothetical protein